nr:unnamed protein product [Callosobruchus analis]
MLLKEFHMLNHP